MYPFEAAAALIQNYGSIVNARAVDYIAEGVWRDVRQVLCKGEVTLIARERHGMNTSQYAPAKEDVASLTERCAALTTVCEPPEDEKEHVKERERGVKARKQRQINAFAQLILEECRAARIDRIVDVGCGLGHLLSSLAASSMRLVGLECDGVLCEKGAQRYDHISYARIRFDSSEECRRLLEQEGCRTAIVSLHGCASVQLDLCRVFAAVSAERVPLMLTLGCCYHRLKPDYTHLVPLSSDDWVMSHGLRDALETASLQLHTPALRLACNQRLSYLHSLSPAEIAATLDEKFARAVAEELRVRGVLTESAARKVRSLDGLTCPAGVEDARARIGIYWTMHFHLQGVLESVILEDRAQFLRDHGCTVSLRPVFPTTASPRNMCIVARR